MELTGTIHKLFDAQDITASFRKRELVLQTDEQYPQTVPVEFVQDRIDLLNGYAVGQKVTISINIRGREWTSPQNETRYFVSIQGWRIQPVQAGAPAGAPAAPASPAAQAAPAAPVAPAPQNTDTFEDDDLPF